MGKYETIGEFQGKKIKVNRFDITGVDAVKLTKRGKTVQLSRYEYLMKLLNEHKEIILNQKGKEIYGGLQAYQRAKKKTVLITELLELPQIGKPVKIRIYNGDIVKTSPVERILLGGQIYIETKNTIYYNYDI